MFPAAAATRRLPALLVGAHSALLSAAKLGILPQILQDEDLSRANGVMEFATYGSTTAGTILGGLLFASFSSHLAALGASEQKCVVASLPADQKGWRLIAQQEPLELKADGLA